MTFNLDTLINVDSEAFDKLIMSFEQELKTDPRNSIKITTEVFPWDPNPRVVHELTNSSEIRLFFREIKKKPLFRINASDLTDQSQENLRIFQNNLIPFLNKGFVFTIPFKNGIEPGSILTEAADVRCISEYYPK